ncbi:hypothetical protein D3C76_1377110 [compost metagenome]
MEQLLVVCRFLVIHYRVGGLGQFCKLTARHGGKNHRLFLTIKSIENFFGQFIHNDESFGCLTEIEHIVAKPDIQKLLPAAL